MSKFLKVIVNLFLVFAILVAGAILVPPILGVSTTIIDMASMDTNLPVGSITYSQSLTVSEFIAGDKVLLEQEGGVYVYVIESADAGSGKFTVVDELSGRQAEAQEMTLRNEALKVVVTVPLIGYIMVAMHSIEGLIIIGLVVLFVIILFILSELWKKSDDDDEEDDEEESAADESKITKGESIAAEKEANIEPEADFTREELARSVMEIREENQEVLAESEDKAGIEEASVQEILSAEEAVEVKQEEAEAASEETEEDQDGFVRVARPSLESILEKAESSGDKPDVVAYDAFDVTVVDYSKLL